MFQVIFARYGQTFQVTDVANNSDFALVKFNPNGTEVKGRMEKLGFTERFQDCIAFVISEITLKYFKLQIWEGIHRQSYFNLLKEYYNITVNYPERHIIGSVFDSTAIKPNDTVTSLYCSDKFIGISAISNPIQGNIVVFVALYPYMNVSC